MIVNENASIEKEIKISQNLGARMLAYSEKVFGCVIDPKFNIADFTKLHFDKKKTISMLKFFSSALPQIEKSARILDAGAGGGLFLAGLIRAGYSHVVGYEVDRDVYLISQDLLKENQIEHDLISLVPGNYSKLPYADGCFDIIFSLFVLEHVKNPIHYLSELKRVLKKNGKICIVCPNYVMPYETHYGLFILPFIFKSLNRIILNMERRSQAIFNDLSFPTPLRLRKWISEAGLIGVNLSKHHFIESLFYDIDCSIRSNYAVFIAKICKKYKLIPLVKILVGIGLYNPLIFILKHRDYV
ncbi:MAG TPA: hypothetical protein DCL49_08910 [Candidatus Omnitrophica bacterium]|nr:hypothetical protein [Candidatus Omnitrophota bacterium]